MDSGKVGDIHIPPTSHAECDEIGLMPIEHYVILCLKLATLTCSKLDCPLYQPVTQPLSLLFPHPFLPI